LHNFDQIMAFLGFGNPAGRFWFIGMEERGEGTDLELQWRLTFERLECLVGVHERWASFKPDDKPFSPTKLIPTWSCMSKLVLRLTGSADWNDVGAVQYQADRLGRLDGDTFLTEVLPLPARNVHDWPSPYVARFSTRDDYEKEVLPARLSRLRRLFEKHRPECVFCYGKSYWKHYREVFAAAIFEPAASGRIEIARFAGSTIVLTPFLVPYRMSNDLIDEIANLVHLGARAPIVG